MGSGGTTAVPLSGSLSISMSPWCSSTNLRESGKPKPVPSYLRFSPLSICLKLFSALATSSWLMPMPVSWIRNVNSWQCSLISRLDMAMFILPFGRVNLTALDKMLRMIWIKRTRSAMIYGRFCEFER